MGGFSVRAENIEQATEMVVEKAKTLEFDSATGFLGRCEITQHDGPAQYWVGSFEVFEIQDSITEVIQIL